LPDTLLRLRFYLDLWTKLLVGCDRMLQRALERLRIEEHAIRVIRMFFLIPGTFFFLVGYLNVLIQTPDATSAIYTSAYVETITTDRGSRQYVLSYGIDGEVLQKTLPRSLVHEYSKAKVGDYLPIIAMKQDPTLVTVESMRSLNRGRYLVLLGGLMLIIGLLPAQNLVSLLED